MELPHFIQIEPVGQCNLRCQMCPVRLRHDGPAHGVAFMAYEVFTRLIDQFHRATELHLQGLGEPMMHPRLFDMIEYAVGRGSASHEHDEHDAAQSAESGAMRNIWIGWPQYFGGFGDAGSL